MAATGLAAPASAAPAIQITSVHYDSPGPDTRSNASLNGEWVKIKNTSRKARALTDWTLLDRSGHLYVFGRFTLKPGKSVTVHTGRGSNTATHRYWGYRAYVWNNTGDEALLFNRNGGRVDSCAWGRGSGLVYC